MTKYRIGKTFEEMEYEEMASSQTGAVNNDITFTYQLTLTWCPIYTATITFAK